MELTPELLLEAKFAPSRRGYDMNEVDDFLERCAEGLDVLLNRLRVEYERAERAEATVAELQAQIASGAPAAPAPVDAELVVEDEPEPAAEVEVEPVAPEPAAGATPDQMEAPMRVLLAAERTAEATVAEARAEAEQLLAEAETMLAEARDKAHAEAIRVGEETKARLEAEVAALRDDREALSTDIASMQQWLAGQRERIRAVAGELARVADGSMAFADEAPDADAASAAPTDGGAGSPTEPSAAEPDPDSDRLRRFLSDEDTQAHSVLRPEPGTAGDSD